MVWQMDKQLDMVKSKSGMMNFCGGPMTICALNLQDIHEEKLCDAEAESRIATFQSSLLYRALGTLMSNEKAMPISAWLQYMLLLPSGIDPQDVIRTLDQKSALSFVNMVRIGNTFI